MVKRGGGYVIKSPAAGQPLQTVTWAALGTRKLGPFVTLRAAIWHFSSGAAPRTTNNRQSAPRSVMVL